MTTKQTPSQTVGPYFAYALTPQAYGREGIACNLLVTDDSQGARIRICGTVLDGENQPVPDALVEIMAQLARGLDLGTPDIPWHNQRDNFAELAGWLSLVTGSLGRISCSCARTKLVNFESKMIIPALPPYPTSQTRLPRKC